ncbi:MAG: hypothetical protein ABIZ72_11525 [Candidatus Limnocylindrales bacterium]
MLRSIRLASALVISAGRLEAEIEGPTLLSGEEPVAIGNAIVTGF